MSPPLLIGGPSRPEPPPRARWTTAAWVAAAAFAGIGFGAWQSGRLADLPSLLPAQRTVKTTPVPTPLPNVLAELNAVFESRASQPLPELPGQGPMAAAPAESDAGGGAAAESARDAVQRAATWQLPAGAPRPPAREAPAAPPVRFAYAAKRGVPAPLLPPRPIAPSNEATVIHLPSPATLASWLQLTPDAVVPVIKPPVPDPTPAESTAKTGESKRGEVEFVFPQVAPLKPKPLPISVPAARPSATNAAPPQGGQAGAAAPPAVPPTPGPVTVLSVLPGTAGAILSPTPPPPNLMQSAAAPPPQPPTVPLPAAGTAVPASPAASAAVPSQPAIVPAGPGASGAAAARVAATAPVHPPGAAVNPLPPPGVPPQVPFAYIGHFSEQGGDVVAFLANGDRLYSVKAGDTVDDDYRVDQVEPNRLTLTYLPLKLKQFVSLSPMGVRGAPASGATP